VLVGAGLGAVRVAVGVGGVMDVVGVVTPVLVAPAVGEAGDGAQAVSSARKMNIPA